MSGNPAPDWRDIFCGRSAQLEALERAYGDVAAGGGPRLVVVLGDRGMGKTRLVQELYRILTTRYDPDDYWPDASLFRGNNLRVAPDTRDDPIVAAHFGAFKLGERRLPFLWWGFRLADPEDRNAVKPDLASHRRFLTPHLAPLLYARRMRQVDEARRENVKDAGKSGALKAIEAIPVLGWLVALGLEATEKIATEAKHRRQRECIAAEQAAARVSELERQEARDAVEATLADLTEILGPQQGLGAVPVVLFVDDAQFARDGGDEGTLRLLTDLWYRARAPGWPLLLVASHWAVDWTLDQGDAGQSFARTFARLMASAAPGWGPIHLGKEPDLLDLIASGLPDLPVADQGLLLDKADGNPQLLIEVIDLVRRSPAWRTGTGALTPFARADLSARQLDLHQLIVRRIEGEATPAAVRHAIVLSSMQGIEFLCALTEIAGEALALGAVAPGLALARDPHRFIADTSQGLAAFVQRAYFEAARAMVPQQLGHTAAVAAALLRAADRIIEDPERWSTLSHDEQVAALGLRATLGETAPEAADRRKAGGAFLSMIRDALRQTRAQDYARAAQLAGRFEQGLTEGRWQAGDFALADLEAPREALSLWQGPGASAGMAEAMLPVARAQAKDPGTPVDRRNLCAVYGHLGDVARGLSRLAEAEDWYEQSRAIHEALAQELDTPEARRALSVSYERLGQIALARSRFAEAQRWCDQARAIHEALAQVRCDISLSYRRLEQIAQTRRRLGKPLAHEMSNPRARRDLAVSYGLLGGIAQARSRLAEAEGWYELSRAIYEALAQELGTPQARRDLAWNYGSLGAIAQARSRLAEAEGWYEQSRAIDEALAQELGTPDARRDLSVSYDRLGQIAQARSRLAEAEGWYEQSRAIHEALAQELGTPEARRDLSVTLFHLAAIAAADQGHEHAYSLTLDATSICRERYTQLQTAQSRQDLIESLTMLVALAPALDRPDADALVGELAEAALGPRLAHETPTMVLNRANALAAIANSRQATDPEGAAASIAESRRLFLSVEYQCAPMGAAGADCAIGLMEAVLDADDGRQLSAQLDALERRLMKRLGDEWEAGGALFRNQIQFLRSQLEEAEGAEP